MFSQEATRLELQARGEAGQDAARDPRLVADITDLLNSTLEAGKALAEGNAIGATLAIANKGATLGGMTADATDSKGGKLGVFVSKSLLASVGLVNLAKATRPSQILATVGATFLKKTALAFDLAGGDDRKARLIAALCDLAGQSMATGVAIAEALVTEAGTAGVGTPLAIGIAGTQATILAATVVNAYRAYQETVGR